MARSFYRFWDVVKWSGEYWRVMAVNGDWLHLRKYGEECNPAQWTFCRYQQKLTIINTQVSIKNPLLVAV